MTYLVKKTYTPTENNPNGKIQNWYCGVSGRTCKDLDWFIKEYAYKTKASLVKGLKAMNYYRKEEESWGNWKIDLDVVILN